MEISRCVICGIEKEVTPDNFYFSKGRYKTKARCRKCLAELNRIYNAKPEVKAQKSEYKKKYRAEHLEEIKEKDRLYRNTEHAKELKQKYYLNNREYFITKTKKHYTEHKKEYADKQREKRQADEVYRLKNNVRKAIRFALNYTDTDKCKRTEEITKLKIDKLKRYLLDTFKNRYGYEWNGIEEVQVDHIIPLITAKTTKEVIDLCYYTNLQLLRKEDNMAKAHYLWEA